MGRKSLAHTRKREIILAFLELASKKGASNVTTREITQAAGLSPGMLHHFFKSKDALILEMVDYMTAVYVADFQKGISKHDSAIERMEFLFSWFFDLNKFDIDWSRIVMEFWALAKTDPAVSRALQDFYRIGRNTLVDIIRSGVKSGEFRKVNPVTMANIMMGSLEGIVVLWLIDSKATSLKAARKLVTEVFMGYLLKEK